MFLQLKNQQINGIVTIRKLEDSNGINNQKLMIQQRKKSVAKTYVTDFNNDFEKSIANSIADKIKESILFLYLYEVQTGIEYTIYLSLSMGTSHQADH